MGLAIFEKLEQTLQSPQRITSQALQSTYAIWVKRYPEWEATFFDEHFLHTHVIPHFSAGEMPSAATLADLWMIQIGANLEQSAALFAELTLVAAEFLYIVESERCYFAEKADRKWSTVRRLVALLNGKSKVRQAESFS